MTESYSFDDLEFFTVGTLGPKGQRVFFLQGRGEGTLVSLKLEKQQVAALADYLDRMLDEFPDLDSGSGTSDLSLREPVVPAWTIGMLGVAYETESDRLILLVEELQADDIEDDIEPAQARFSLRRDQVMALVDRARDVVAAGRPPCPYCQRPMEARNGDWCACSN